MIDSHEFVFDRDEVEFLLEALICWEQEHAPLEQRDRELVDRFTAVFRFALD